MDRAKLARVTPLIRREEKEQSVGLYKTNSILMIDVLEREIEIKELLIRRQRRRRRHLNGMQGLFWNTYIHCTISESLAVDAAAYLYLRSK